MTQTEMCCETLINAVSANVHCAVGVSIAYLCMKVNQLENVLQSF